MTEREATDLAARALPCPFCGERLVVIGYRAFTYFVRHQDEHYQCFIYSIEIWNADGLDRWNTRAEPTTTPLASRRGGTRSVRSIYLSAC